MPEHSIRFGVRTDEGRSSDVWKCWTNTGTGKRDVFLTSRPLGTALKLTLHETGRWHVGFHTELKDKLFPGGTAPPTRFLGVWNRGALEGRVWTLAARVYFPWHSPSAPHRDADKEVVWLASAPKGLANEVAVFLVSTEADAREWPGRDSLGTTLVGTLPLDQKGIIFIVHRPTDTWPRIPEEAPAPKYFAGKGPADIAEANRAVAWDEEPDGSISFIEMRVRLVPKGAA
jgi:hypothetical protein